MTGPLFRVMFTGLAREQFLLAVRRARNVGRPAELTAAMRALLRHLSATPLETGEPMYRISSMKMDIRRAAISPVYLEYGVHGSAPEVVIIRVLGMVEPD